MNWTNQLEETFLANLAEGTTADQLTEDYLLGNL